MANKKVTKSILGTNLVAKFEGSYAGEQLRDVRIAKVAYNPVPPEHKPEGGRTNIVAVYFEMDFVRVPRKKRK